MCIVYRGTEYHYGFTIQTSSQSRQLHILMTQHMEERPYVYGGLCLDNGLQVVTDKRERYAALHDIIGKVVDGTISIEKAYAERYSSQPFRPFKNIFEEEPQLYRRFIKRMEKSYSLFEYKNIRKKLSPLFDRGVIGTKTSKSVVTLQTMKVSAILAFIGILPHSVPILYDCKDMILASNLIQNDPRFNDSRINYCRV